jgi:hypothetical protein
MATVASIIQNIRVAFGDPDGDFITNAIGMEWLDVAQQRFCDEVMPLDEIKDYGLTSRLQRYDLPTNTVTVNGVMWFKYTTRKLEWAPPATFDEIQSASPNANPGNPCYYTVFRQQIVVGPQSPSANSATALASGAITAAATTLGLTAASGTFRTRGFLVNSTTGEVVEYTNVATTTVTGVTRGVHGTTAASCASGEVWTEVDMQVKYRKIPAALTTTSASPEVPAVHHRYLEQYVLYLAWRNRGDTGKAEIAYNEFESMEKRAREKVGRRAWENVRIKDRRHSARNYGFYGD